MAERIAAIAAIAVVALWLPASATAHGTHQHGLVKVDVVVDATGFELALESDGEGIVGFEQAPADAAEHAAVKNASATLRAGAALVSAPAEAGCTLASAQVQSPYEATTATAGHVDWRATYRFDCRTPAAITRLDFSGLFAAFPGARQLRLQAVSDRGQTGADLTAARPTASLSSP